MALRPRAGNTGSGHGLGFVASKFSFNVGLEEIAKEEGEKKPEIGSWAMIGSMFVSIGFFIFMYKFVPLAGRHRH